MKIKSIILEWSPGTIYDKLENAVNLAKTNGCDVEFPFNGVNVIVSRRSNPEDFDLVIDAVNRKLNQVLV